MLLYFVPVRINTHYRLAINGYFKRLLFKGDVCPVYRYTCVRTCKKPTELLARNTW